MEPERSSRDAARRIVEEVLADHATRASAGDGVAPPVVSERPDTAAWHAARRIVQETLAEHAARAVVPPRLALDVAVDLEARHVEVVLDLDGPVPPPSSARRAASDVPGPDTDGMGDPPATPEVVVVVEPIDVDESPGRAARRIVEAVLKEHGIATRSPGSVHGARAASDGNLPVEPAPADGPEPECAAEAEPELAVETEPDPPEPTTEPEPEPATEDEPTPSAAVELPTPDPEPPTPNPDQEPPTPDPEPPTPDPDPEPPTREPDPEPQLTVPTDDDTLRSALSDLLFAPVPDPGTDDGDDDGPPPIPSAVRSPVAATPVTATSMAIVDADGDPDDPTVIAARIVAGVLADRQRTEAEAAASVPDLPEDDPEADRPTGTLVFGAAPERLDGDGWTRPLDASPEHVLATAEPSFDGAFVDEVIVGEGPLAADNDEFGAWPDPIVPPRRTGRWLLTTIIGAVLLALLLPLAIGAVRDLLSFS